MPNLGDGQTPHSAIVQLHLFSAAQHGYSLTLFTASRVVDDPRPAPLTEGKFSHIYQPRSTASIEDAVVPGHQGNEPVLCRSRLCLRFFFGGCACVLLCCVWACVFVRDLFGRFLGCWLLSLLWEFHLKIEIPVTRATRVEGRKGKA